MVSILFERLEQRRLTGLVVPAGVAELSQPSRSPQPFVKWAGGKSQLLARISRLLPSEFGSYYEPFVGGGAVFFHLKPKQAVISDANFELINTYKIIRNELSHLTVELEALQKERISRKLFERIRNQDPETLTRPERAARFIFLNKTCYNGLYRVNRRGRFNVPFGKYSRMPRLYDPSNLKQISMLLKAVDVKCASYEIPLMRARKGDFVYLDPPYAEDQEAPSFTSYTKKSFSENDQEQLAAKFKELDKRGCLLMLSNSNTKTTRELYSDYEATTFIVKADRMINSVGSERKGFNEFLILNFIPNNQTLLEWLRPH